MERTKEEEEESEDIQTTKGIMNEAKKRYEINKSQYDKIQVFAILIFLLIIA